MSDFTAVPTVDFGRLQNETTRQEELLKLQDALFRVGFLYLLTAYTGQDLIHGLHLDLPQVFAISKEERERVNMRNSPSFLGYTALGAETTALKTDLREQFDFGTAIEAQWRAGDPNWKRLEGPSQFPSLHGLQEKIEAYTAALDRISKAFLGFVAESLSLPADTFNNFLGNMHRLKLVKYPPSPAGSQGVGPHKDSTGLFTFLSQDNVGGLQVLSKSGKWIDAPPVEGSLVVNVQQGFEAITGGVCPATTHRVIAPTSSVRYSIPFFQAVRLDLTLAQLKDSAAHIVARIPTTDDRKKRAVDVPSEFLSPQYECFGEAQLRNRVVSHPDVGQKWYPDLYARYVEQRLPAV